MEQSTKSQANGTLTLTGEGQVTAKPDMATITLGVLTTSRSAEEALRENAALMGRVAAKMRALGVPSEDLQTVGIAISPVVDYDENSPTRGQITSYRVEDALRVRTSLEKAARVLDEGVSAGANVAGSLSFGLRNEAKFRELALQAAVQAARADADVVAGAMRVSIKRAKSAEVISGGNPIVLRNSLHKTADATPIEPGNLTISATVRVVYEFRARR